MNDIKKLSIIVACSALIGSVAFGSSQDPSNSSPYRPAGFAVQLATNAASLAYYSTNDRYTTGIEINPYRHGKTTSKTGKKTTGYEVSFSAFGRRNFLMPDNRTLIGCGLLVGTGFDTDVKSSYFAGAYLALEYRATKHVYLAASFTPLKYGKDKFKNGSSMSGWEVGKGGAVQIAYKF